MSRINTTRKKLFTPKINMLRLTQLWCSTTTVDEICKILAISRNRLHRLVRDHKLPKKSRANDGMGVFKDPTPEEIAAAAAECRKKWTPREYELRAGIQKFKPMEYRPLPESYFNIYSN